MGGLPGGSEDGAALIAAGDRRPRVFELRSGAGLEATVLDHGATLARLRVPDASGRLVDVVLGFDDPGAYRGPHPYVGGVVGRYANRIAGARFELDGKPYLLEANEGRHCLHGGPHGFDRAVWDAEALGDDAVELRLRSPDGDGGFPGSLEVCATYRVDGRSLLLRWVAATDAPTVLSLAHHAYWNLADGGATSILDHELEIAAQGYTPVGEDGIPTGVLASVAGTPFDFRTRRAIGARIGPLLALRGGYDHNFALDFDAAGASGRPAARLACARSGLVLAVSTTLPGLQLYTGGCFDGTRAFRGGVRSPRFGAVALEAQQFPNAPNEPRFPSARLDPGARQEHQVVYALEAG